MQVPRPDQNGQHPVNSLSLFIWENSLRLTWNGIENQLYIQKINLWNKNKNTLNKNPQKKYFTFPGKRKREDIIRIITCVIV